MIELISIHIPKTGGTSFYQILQQVYGNSVSKPYKRRDYLEAIEKFGYLEMAIHENVKILHGHFYYKELKKLHVDYHAKVVCWLRDPVERVISNYLFFKAGFQNPNRNFRVYQKNKHRKNETLLEYAQKEENRNRITSFLEGIALEDLFFIGFLSKFEEDIQHLGNRLGWPKVKPKQLNQTMSHKKQQFIEDKHIYHQLVRLNAQDIELYEAAKKMHLK